MNKADPAGLTAPVEASAIYSSMRIVSNDVTLTPVQSGKKKKKKKHPASNPERYSATGQHK